MSVLRGGGRHQPSTARFAHASARAVVAASVGLYAVVIAVEVVLEGMAPVEFSYVAAYGVVLIVSGLLGMAILRRQARHSIGWMFLGLTAYIPSTVIASTVAAIAGHSELEEWLGHWTWIPVVTVPLTFIPLLFPDGRLLTPRWRVVAWLSGIGILGYLLYTMFGPHLGGAVEFGENPYHLGTLSTVGSLLGFLFLPGVAGSAAAAVLRYRRSRGVVRQQIKWPAYGALLALLAVLSVAVTSTFLDLDETLANLVVIGGISLVPVTVGLGVVRYRLYDIDRLISRTLAYSIVVAVLAVSYGALVSLLGLWAALGDDFTVAVSTLAAAALFQPLRVRVMRWVERRFHRLAYDREIVIDDLRNRLRAALSVERVAGELAAVVRDTLQPSRMGMWIAAER